MRGTNVWEVGRREGDGRGSQRARRKRELRALHLGSQGKSRFPEGKAQWWQLPEKLGLQKSMGHGKWDSGGHSRSRESCGRSLMSMV